MGKETKQQEKGILDRVIEEGPSVLDVNFMMDEVTLKKGVRRLKFSVGTTLKKTDRFYRVKLYFNSEDYLNRIEANLRLIAEINDKKTLFDATKEGDQDKKSRIKKIEEENKNHKKEMDRLDAMCTEYEFTGEAEKVEYNKDTLVLKIDKDTLSFLNDKADLFCYYKMLLRPIV